MKPARRHFSLLRAMVLLAVAPLVARALPTAAQIRTAFNAVDSSRNASISAEEWDQASFALFRAADKNNDDAIDREELGASTIAPDTFLRADLDRNERLSVGEFAEHRRALLEICDIDRNEFLSEGEFELMILMEKVGWLDANQNGRIELSELTASLLRVFGEIDTDRDSALTAAEAGYMRPVSFKRFDINRDGALSREEFVAGYRSEILSG